MPEGHDQYAFRPAPALTHSDEMDRAVGVVVGAGFGPELELGMIFAFIDGAGGVVRTIFLAGYQPMLPALVTDAVAAVKQFRDDPEAQRAVVESLLAKLIADQAPVHTDAMSMVRATNVPVHCPGCGRQLFGEVAARGGCVSCYPELPAGGSPL